MQRATTASHSAIPARNDGATCPVCGEPVRGIASSKPGEHRFVGCDHYASARLLRPDLGAPDERAGIRIGP